MAEQSPDPTDVPESELVVPDPTETTFEFPNSPGVTVHVTRGGFDPVTREAYSDQWVQLSWTDPSGTPQTCGFLGP